jgi:VCBS repeat-containing protein
LINQFPRLHLRASDTDHEATSMNNVGYQPLAINGASDPASIAAPTVAATPVSEGFENGFGQTWSVSGQAAIEAGRQAGTHAAFIGGQDDSANVSQDQIEQTLALPAGALDRVNGSDATAGSAISTSQGVASGTYTLSFAWRYQAGDVFEGGFNDFAFVSINGIVHKLADVATVGDNGDSGWQSCTLTLYLAGPVTLGFGAINAVDNSYSGNLWIDDVTLTGSAGDRGVVSEGGVDTASGAVSVSDPDPGEAHAEVVATPQPSALGYGTYTVTADGQWTYVLDNGNAAVQGLASGETATDSFAVWSQDGSASRTVTITIAGANDTPEITGPVTLAPIAEDGDARLITQAELLAHAVDVDGPSLAAANLAITSGSGTLTDNHDGTWTYRPADDDDTAVAFSYTVSDGIAPVAASATLDITPVNDVPRILVQGSHLDIVSGNVASDDVSVLLGNGLGGFSADITVLGGGFDPRSIALGDVDRNGTLDIVTANSQTDNISVLLGDGLGHFSGGRTGIGGGDSPFSVALGDLDGNGTLDIVTANSNSANLSILLGNGNGGFAAGTRDLEGGLGPVGVALGDFDGDGDLDIVTANFDSNDVSLLLGDGAGNFIVSSLGIAGGTSPRSVALGDVNGDGALDIVTANLDSNDVSVLFGDGHGRFTASTTALQGGNAPVSVALGDINGDGALDIVTANIGSNDVSVLLGDGAGKFAASTIGIDGSGPFSVALGDMNGDGALDIVLANANSHNVGVLLGNGDGSFVAGSTGTGGGFGPLAVAIGELDHAQRVDEDASLVFDAAHGNAITLADVDANGDAETVTLAVAHGALTLASVAGLTVSGDGTGSVNLTGSVAAINAALGGLSYRPGADYNGGDTLTITATDNGNIGAGGALPTTKLVPIIVNPVNDAPSITAETDPAAVTEAADAQVQDIPAITGTLTATDIDTSDVLTGAVTGDGVAMLNGSAILPAGVDLSALIAAGAISFTTVPTDGGAVTLTWTWDPEAANLDFLTQGDVLTITYTAQVNDGHGNVGSQPLTVTINGSNDAASIAVPAAPVTPLSDGFENGFGQVWTVTGYAAIDTGIVKAGTRSALISGDNDHTGTSEAQIEQALALPAGALDHVNGIDAVGGSAISTSQVLAAGTYTLSFQYYYQSGDWYSPGFGNDFAFVSINGAVHALTDVATVGDAGNVSGWQSFTLTLDLAGAVTLGFGAINSGDNDNDYNGALWIDQVALTATALGDHGVVIRNEAASASGTVTVSDLDHGEAHTQVVATPRLSALGYGTYTVTADGQWAYVLDNGNAAVQHIGPGETLTDTFTLWSQDGTASKAVTITIEGGNNPPTLADVNAGTLTDTAANDSYTSLTGTLGGSDPDSGDAATLTYAAMNGTTASNGAVVGSYGTLTVDSAGHYTYAPNATAINALPAGAFADTFTLQVKDTHGASATATLTVNLNGANDTPTLANVSGGVFTDTVASDSFANATGTIKGADRDAGETLTYAALNGATPTSGAVTGSYGTLTVASNGSYTYVPDAAAINALRPGSFGDVFTLQVTDAHGASTTASLAVTVSGANDRPTLANVNATLTDTAANDSFANLTGKLAGSDLDSGQTATLTYAVMSGTTPTNAAVTGTYGALTVDSAGNYTYVPKAAATLNALPSGAFADTFTLQVKDANGLTSTATLTVNVAGANDTPTVASVIPGTLTDTAANDSFGNLTGMLSGTDRDSGDFSTLSYAALDGTTPSNGAVKGSYGSLTVASNGSYTYVPDPAAINALPSGSALDTFTLRVMDAHGASSTATLTVNLNGANDTPALANINIGTLADTAAYDSFADLTGTFAAVDPDSGETLSYAGQISPSVTTDLLGGNYGTLSVDSTGQYTYHPKLTEINALSGGAFTDTFTVRVTDSHGARTTATVTVNVTGTNDAPTLSNQSPATVLQDTYANDSFGNLTGAVTGGDAESGDKATLTYAALDGTAASNGPVAGAYGTLTISSAGTYTYVPDAAAINALPSGAFNDAFTLQVKDAHGGSSTATLTVIITGANDGATITAPATTVTVLSETFVAGFGQTWTVEGTATDTRGQVYIRGDGVAPEAEIEQALGLTAGTLDHVNGYDAVGGSAIATSATLQAGTYTLSFDWRYRAGGNYTSQNNDFAFVSIDGQAYKITDVATVGSWGDTLFYQRYSLTLDLSGPVTIGFGAINTGETFYTSALSLEQVTLIRGTPSDVGSIDADDATVSGAAIVLDLDRGESHMQAVATARLSAQGYGTYTVTADGEWTYRLDGGNAAVQHLGLGQTAYDTFTLLSQDGSASKTVTITIHGSNHAPAITGAATDTILSEDADAHAQDLPEIGGTLTLIDTDTGNTLIASVTGDAVAALNGSTTLPAGVDVSALTAARAIVFSPATSNGGAQTLPWTWDPSTANLDFLRQGDVLTITYTAQVDDGFGNVGSQPVTITVEGTNDAPVITAATSPAFVAEADDAHAQDIAAVTGTLTASDLDIGDTLTASVTGDAVAMLNGAAGLPAGIDLSALIASGAVSFTTVTPDGGAITLTWTWNPAAANLDFLAQGDVLTITYMAQVNDGHGNVGSQPLTVTITGTNDAPVVSATATLAPIAEDSGARLITQAELLTHATDVDSASLVAANLAIASGLGTLTDNHDGTWTYKPAANDHSAVTFSYTVNDGIVAVAASATLDITPVNHAPVIAAETDPAAITEAADAHAQDIAAITGTLTATDADIGDTLTASVTRDGIAKLNGSASLPASVDLSALTASGAVSFTTATTDGGAVTLTWTWDPAAADLDFLRQGDVLTITYMAQVDDGFGHVGSQPLTITISGTNDAPVITGAAAETVVEEADAHAQDIVEISGSLTVIDADIGDTLTGTVTGDAVAALNGSTTLPAGIDLSALTAARTMLIWQETSNGGEQTLNWTWDPLPVNLDFLRQGDVLTITYMAQVNDGHGNVGSQPVTITIIGTNDAPVITAATSPAAVSEMADAHAQGVAITATLTVTDRDIGDTLTASVTGDAVATLNGATSLPAGVDLSALIASGAISFTTATTDGGTQALTWTWNPPAANLDFLRQGDVLAITYTAQVNDGHGNVGAQPLTVTIMGTNDAPVVSGPATLAPIAEDSGARLITQSELLAHVVDVDSPTLSAANLAIASGLGRLTDNHDGTWSYTPAANDDSAVTFSYMVSDGIAAVAASAALDITPVNHAPVLHDVATTADYAGGLVILAPGVTISDVDSTTLVSASVHISAGTFAADGDVLAVGADGLGGTSIVASYNAATETLTLSGTDTLAHYARALEHVTFQSTSADPTHSGSDPTRTVDWQLNDGSATDNLSTIQTTTVHLSGPPPISGPTPKPPANDLDGDGHSDILWQTDGGQLAGWEMNGVQVGFADYTKLGQSNVGLPGADWHVVDTGDFDGDGKSDLLWRTDSGALAIWEMDGTHIQAADYTRIGATSVAAPGADWHVLGAADFDGDGKSDLLWRTDSGALAIWEMNGSQIKGADYTKLGSANVGAPGPDWHIVGTDDFDGDGKSDLLWQTDSGALAIWEMNGTQVKAADYLKIGGSDVGAPGHDWHVIGTGDFDGDGKSDLLWQTDSGALAIWEMNGTQIKAADYIKLEHANIGVPGPDWHFAATSDYNGDGKSDLLWRTDSGALAIWQMDGTQISLADYIKLGSADVGAPGSDWHTVQHHYDLI